MNTSSSSSCYCNNKYTDHDHEDYQSDDSFDGNYTPLCLEFIYSTEKKLFKARIGYNDLHSYLFVYKETEREFDVFLKNITFIDNVSDYNDDNDNDNAVDKELLIENYEIVNDFIKKNYPDIHFFIVSSTKSRYKKNIPLVKRNEKGKIIYSILLY